MEAAWVLCCILLLCSDSSHERALTINTLPLKPYVDDKTAHLQTTYLNSPFWEFSTPSHPERMETKKIIKLRPGLQNDPAAILTSSLHITLNNDFTKLHGKDDRFISLVTDEGFSLLEHVWIWILSTLVYDQFEIRLWNCSLLETNMHILHIFLWVENLYPYFFWNLYCWQTVAEKTRYVYICTTLWYDHHSIRVYMPASVYLIFYTKRNKNRNNYAHV